MKNMEQITKAEQVLIKKALAEYGSTIKSKGARAGEPVIKKWEKKIPNFKKWAYAVGIMLRSDELLKEALANKSRLYQLKKRWLKARGKLEAAQKSERNAFRKWSAAARNKDS